MKSIEKFYDMPMGSYCGVLLREKTAKALGKLLYKQNQEIKELLASDLSQIEVSDWTLVYPNGKQTSIKYYIPRSSDEEKINRINLIDKTKLINYCNEGVFVAGSEDSAKITALEWFEQSL